MCPKIMTPHHFKCKKVTKWDMIPKQKWSQMTQDILGKTLIWPQIVTCVTSTHNWPLTNFLPIWLVNAACDKIAHTVSPNHLCQISLPRASMPFMTSFYCLQFNGTRSNLPQHIFKCVQKSWPSPLWVQKSNKMNETATWPHVYQMGPPSLGGGHHRGVPIT